MTTNLGPVDFFSLSALRLEALQADALDARRAAQNAESQQVAHLRAAAERVKDESSSALIGGLIQGGLTLASAGCTFKSASAEPLKATRLMAYAKGFEASGSIAHASFECRAKRSQADQHHLSADAKLAEQTAGEARTRERDCNEQYRSLLALCERRGDALHEQHRQILAA